MPLACRRRLTQQPAYFGIEARPHCRFDNLFERRRSQILPHAQEPRLSRDEFILDLNGSGDAARGSVPSARGPVHRPECPGPHPGSAACAPAVAAPRVRGASLPAARTMQRRRCARVPPSRARPRTSDSARPTCRPSRRRGPPVSCSPPPSAPVRTRDVASDRRLRPDCDPRRGLVRRRKREQIRTARRPLPALQRQVRYSVEGDEGPSRRSCAHPGATASRSRTTF